MFDVDISDRMKMLVAGLAPLQDIYSIDESYAWCPGGHARPHAMRLGPGPAFLTAWAWRPPRPWPALEALGQGWGTQAGQPPQGMRPGLQLGGNVGGSAAGYAPARAGISVLGQGQVAEMGEGADHADGLVSG